MHARRLDGSPLATCVRLCLLQLPVDLKAAAAALTRGGVESLLALGLAATDGSLLRPRARIVPAEELLMAFDGFARGADDPVGFVAPYTPTASWLAALTPRRRAARALDVGTGNGIHALLAAAHCEQVIATDVNHRALAFTEINAAMNGARQHRDAAGKPLRPGRGRAVRPDHLQRAVRRLARVALAVPRRRAAGRRALAARGRTGGGCARRRRARLTARQLGRRVRGRARRARGQLARRTRAATLGCSASRAPIRSSTRPAGTSTSRSTRRRTGRRSTSGRLLRPARRRAGSARARCCCTVGPGRTTRSASTRRSRTSSSSPASRSSASSPHMRGSAELHGEDALLDETVVLAREVRIDRVVRTRRTRAGDSARSRRGDARGVRARSRRRRGDRRARRIS